MTKVTMLVPLCACPLCGKRAIVELTPEQRLAQPDDTTHVCHPALGGCNHGFTDDRTREPEQTCPSCRGTILPRSVSGAKRGTCHCPENLTNQETEMTKTTKDTAPKTPGPVAEAPKAPRVPKPLDFAPEGDVRAVKADSKVATLIDLLARPEGASL